MKRKPAKPIPREEHVTGPARALLARMVERGDDADIDYDGELVGSDGSWFLGSDRVDPGIVKQLLRLVLIRDVSTGELLRFEVNDEGRKAAADPFYVPQIYARLRQQFERDFDGLDSESESR